MQYSYLYWLLFCCIVCNLISSLVSRPGQHFAKTHRPLRRLLKTTEHNSHEPIRYDESATADHLDLYLQVHRKIDNCVHLRSWTFVSIFGFCCLKPGNVCNKLIFYHSTQVIGKTELMSHCEFIRLNPKKRALSNFAFQHCQESIGTQNKKKFSVSPRDS